MFLFKKTAAENFDDRIKAAKYERILQTLKDILRIEVKMESKEGQEETDYAATCSAIKTKARLAIDFVADLEKGGDD